MWHSEFKKTVVAVRSIRAAGSECEEEDEGREFRGHETEIVEVERNLFYLFSAISFMSHGCISFFLLTRTPTKKEQ